MTGTAMTSLQDLDDPTKACVYLAPREDLQDDASTRPGLPSPFASRDIPEGYVLRLRAYQQAWSKCLERVQSIVRELNAPVVSSVVKHIREAHDPARTLPGIPYPELPVVAISSPGGSSILDDVLGDLKRAPQPRKDQKANGTKGRRTKRNHIDSDDDAAENTTSPRRTITITHVFPADCPNLTSIMKAIVLGFVDKPPEEDEDEHDIYPQALKRKATTSLASYDINLLEAWYAALEGQSGSKPLLIVIMHDFEQFETTILRDMFDICSQHVTTLPLVILATLSAPSPTTYLRGALPRSTIALLRVETATAPNEIMVLEEVLNKTFFDVNFDPDVMLGPATLDFVVEYGTRHAASVCALLTNLQLAHLKHFEDPLTAFIYDNLLGERFEARACTLLQQPASFNFLDALLSRLWPDVADQPTLDRIQIDQRSPSVEGLLKAVSAARTDTRKQATRMRLGFRVWDVITKFMQAEGYKTTTGRPEENGLGFMLRAVRGRLGKDVKYLGLMVKKLSPRQLSAVLRALHHLFQSLESPSLRRDEEAARVLIVTANAQLPEDISDDTEHDAISTQVAVNVSEWVVEYVESRVARLDQGVLWDVWNTGMTPFPSELVNPAPRLTIINALLHPYEIMDAHRKLFGDSSVEGGGGGPQVDTMEDDDRRYALWELPDTSILFRRYMDSGKMINIYDWYQSFAGVLDTQRERSCQREGARTPRPAKEKGKGKQRAVEEGADVEEEGGEEAEEQWRIEVQARFIRALHELDFMGFVKHTGRKADHVIKTIYDLPD